MNLKDYIYNIESFDEKGKSVKDISPIFENGEVFAYTIKEMSKEVKQLKPEIIVSPESKGFILGAGVATKLGLGIVPVRNPKNLSREFVKASYTSEHGDTKELACHTNSISKGCRVVIVDDKLQTGNTTYTTAKLIERLGGEVVGIITLLEIIDKGGRDRLKDYNVISLVSDTSNLE